MAKKRIDVEIGVKNKIAAGLKSVKAALRRFGQTAGKILKGVAVASIALGSAIVALGIKAVKAFSVQEMAEKSLIEAMLAHGDAVDELLPKYKKLASAIQDETGIADESTLATIAKLRTIGVANDQMERAVKLTLALGKAGMREKTALRAAADAMNGNTTQLTTYIPELRNAKTEAQKLAIVNDLMARGYQQLTGELDTQAGRWNEFKGRIGDVLEQIGKAITGGLDLKDTLAFLSDKIKNIGKSKSFNEFLDKIKLATTSARNLVKVLMSGNVSQAVGTLGDIIRLSFLDGAERAGGLIARSFKEAYRKMISDMPDGKKKNFMVSMFGAGSVQLSEKARERQGLNETDAGRELKKIFNRKITVTETPIVPKASNPISNLSSVGSQIGGISESTSMLSAGDLFTMMQTGSDSKATMISEQQKTNEKLDQLIDLAGGVE